MNRIKKVRENLPGFTCEICKNFYEAIGENDGKMCKNCSRHRTNENINETPKGFYDLNI